MHVPASTIAFSLILDTWKNFSKVPKNELGAINQIVLCVFAAIIELYYHHTYLCHVWCSACTAAGGADMEHWVAQSDFGVSRIRTDRT